MPKTEKPETNDAVPGAVPKPSLKDRLKDALRKTGHVSEAGLDVVAETAAAIVLGGQFGV